MIHASFRRLAGFAMAGLAAAVLAACSPSDADRPAASSAPAAGQTAASTPAPAATPVPAPAAAPAATPAAPAPTSPAATATPAAPAQPADTAGTSAAAVPAVSAPSAPPALERVRYAGFSGVSGLGVRLGIEKGFFEEEGIALERIETRDPLPGLASGDVDIADWNTTGSIIAAGKGLPITVISSLFRQVGPFYLVGAPGIESVADLEGKTVGVAMFRTGLEIYARSILQQQGVDLGKVTFVSNGVNAAALATLENGSVDATIIHEPFASLAEASGKGKVLAAGYEFLPRFHTGVIVASDRFVAEQPERIRKFLRAYFKSNQYAKDNLGEYTAYYARVLNVDPAVAEAAVARELPIWANDPTVSLEQLRETQEVQRALGFQDEIYDAERFVDTSLIPGR